MADAAVIGTNAYQDITAADAYMVNSVRGAAKWAALSDDEKNAALITSTRIFDKQWWQGTKTQEAPTQLLDFPRTGMIDRHGNPIDDSTVPDDINYGSIEFAYDLSQDPSLEESGGQGSNVKKVEAGSAKVTFFKATGGVNGVGSQRFSPDVQEYISQYLDGAANVGTGAAYGTGGSGSFDGDENYPLNMGY